VKSEHRTLVVYEAPHRLLECLHDLRDVLGERQIAVARELTKLHEEMWRGPLSGAIARYETVAPRGEITLVIGGAVREESILWSTEAVRAALAEHLASGESRRDAARAVAAESGWSRRDVYGLDLSER
jgi:16S rRNA (cytidine1402-2'-O)-methyltransferase